MFIIGAKWSGLSVICMSTHLCDLDENLIDDIALQNLLNINSPKLKALKLSTWIPLTDSNKITNQGL